MRHTHFVVRRYDMEINRTRHLRDETRCLNIGEVVELMEHDLARFQDCYYEVEEVEAAQIVGFDLFDGD